MHLCPQNKQINTLVVGIELKANKIIKELAVYAKLRRIKKVVLFMMNDKPTIEVESPFEWYNPKDNSHFELFNSEEYRMESIRARYDCELVMIFAKRLNLRNVPYFAISQSEIAHCRYNRISGSISSADQNFQNCQQRLGK